MIPSDDEDPQAVSRLVAALERARVRIQLLEALIYVLGFCALAKIFVGAIQ